MPYTTTIIFESDNDEEALKMHEAALGEYHSIVTDALTDDEGKPVGE